MRFRFCAETSFRQRSLVPLTALLSFNVVALSCRRDIANLGVIYRAVISRGPKVLWMFFTIDGGFRCTSPRFSFHRYHVRDAYRELQRDYINRNTFRFIITFNLLHECVLISDSVKFPISKWVFNTISHVC